MVDITHHYPSCCCGNSSRNGVVQPMTEENRGLDILYKKKTEDTISNCAKSSLRCAQIVNPFQKSDENDELSVK